ncbi:von Willebrand factor type A domain protein [Candidatus Methanoperedenaceae archaeon GB37]|nr:von Willebrand factor type A domain protein [Candidatus Methanoperedenaceae archaeon GB37]
MNFEEPLLLLLISPVLLAGFYLMRRRFQRGLILTRLLAISLLLAALAGPFTITSHTIRDDAPQVTVIADKTVSCDLYDPSEGESLYEYLKVRTPSQYREISGVRTALGDEILKSSGAGKHIVLVSDLNNNYGVEIRDAIALARSEGAYIYAVEQTPIHTDTGIEIVGAKNIVAGNENTYHAIVRHVGDETTYTLHVEADGRTLYDETITQSEKRRVIPFTYTPQSEGSHRITATITPHGEDRFKLNNVFYKSVFAAPKPRILYEGDDSPLEDVLSELYDVDTSGLGGAFLDEYRAVVIENRDAEAIEPHVDKLREYVTGGGGLLVVGGENAFDRGMYNNTEFEEILPVLSKPSKYGGGRNIVIVIDASGSTDAIMYDETKFIGQIDALAQSIVNNRNIAASTKIGVVAFGSSAEKIDFLSATAENKQILNQKISMIGPESGSEATNMDKGLREAGEMLKGASGVKTVIVLSDGNIREGTEDAIETAARELVDAGITLYFRQVGVGPESTRAFTAMEKIAESVGADYQYIGTSGINIQFEPLPEAPEEEKGEEEVLHQFGLTVTDGEHFITRYQNISGDITGYNDVTTKLGARRLVATATGKPVLSVWSLGLGRAAALTTDNGKRWAGILYTAPNSKLISSTLNWLIGDPRPGGETITAPDLWLGRPEKITIKTREIPEATFDGKPLSFSREGDEYRATVEPESAGFHTIDGYELAANYPLEYRKIGFNTDVKTAIEEENGTVHPYEEAKTLLFGEIKTNSVRIVNEPRSQKMPFILAAIIIFLGEIILRRLQERKVRRDTNA